MSKLNNLLTEFAALLVGVIILTVVAFITGMHLAPKSKCVTPYDYQIELHNDTTWLYDGDRLVGITIDSTYSGKGLYDLITKDNE